MIRTLKFQLILFTLVINLVILALCALILDRSIRESRGVIEENYRHMLSEVILRNDDVLESGRTAVAGMRTTQLIRDFRQVQGDATERFYFYQDVREELDRMHNGYPGWLNFFFYYPGDDYLIFNRYSGSMAGIRPELTASMTAFQAAKKPEAESFVSLNGSPALLYALRAEGMVLGFHADLAQLAEEVRAAVPGCREVRISAGDGLSAETGKPLGMEITVESRRGMVFRGDFAQPDISWMMGRTPLLVTLALLCTLLSVPMGLWFYSRKIFLPLRRLLFGLKRVQENDLSCRLKETGKTAEFNQLSRNFNEMTRNIRELEEDIEREQKAKQEMEMAWLMHQIRPHFILNNLNQIYTLAAREECGEIQGLSQSLSEYMRYVLRTDARLLPVREELDHIENYLSIYRRSHPDNFEYRIDCSRELDRALIPTYLINTVLENSLQHAGKGEGEGKLQIEIRIFREPPEAERLTLLITDNGRGFDEEVMRHVNGFSDFSHYISSHIGLRNIKYRLHLLYGERAEMRIYNPEKGGSAVRIEFPERE